MNIIKFESLTLFFIYIMSVLCQLYTVFLHFIGFINCFNVSMLVLPHNRYYFSSGFKLIHIAAYINNFMDVYTYIVYGDILYIHVYIFIIHIYICQIAQNGISILCIIIYKDHTNLLCRRNSWSLTSTYVTGILY